MPSALIWLAIVTLAASLFTCDDAATRDTPRDPNRIYSETELEQALLTPMDLGGSEWEMNEPPGPSQDDDEANETNIWHCDQSTMPKELLDPPALSRAFEDTTSGGQGPFIYQFVTSLALADAQALIAQLRQSFSCSEFLDSRGEKWTISALPISDLGDETLAYRLSGTATLGARAQIDEVIIRDGSVVSFLVHLAIPSVEGSKTDRYTHSMLKRLDDLP